MSVCRWCRRNLPHYTSHSEWLGLRRHSGGSARDGVGLLLARGDSILIWFNFFPFIQAEST
jgi:hypothetical protein